MISIKFGVGFYSINKVQGIFFLCLIKNHIVTTCGGMNVQPYTFLTSALDGDKWSH
jgi:hypothetical protein